MAAQTWLSRNIAVYRDNPTALRDFRAQLRGNKAIALWTLYLFIMMGYTLINYYTVTNGGSLSVTDIQFRLRAFYDNSMYMLAAAICLITPSLTAGSIVVERQRKSLDLLFSAPVSLKGMLVGKMIGAYRYTLMLLILSIPMTSVAVVMGGATWGDVLQIYADLSFAGLVLTSIGLMISSLSESVGAAVIWTYLASGFYLYITAIFGAPPVNMGAGTSFLPAMNPFFAVSTGPTNMLVAGHQIPNFIFVGIASVLICRILLLGAASQLSPFGSPETRGFRLQTVLYCFVGLIMVGLSDASPFEPRAAADAIGILCGCLILFLPNILCYGSDGGRKFGYNGRPRLEGTFTGARSGSLSYVLLLWLAIVLGVAVAVAIHRSPSITAFASPEPWPFSSYASALFDGSLWTLAFIFMLWGLARGISARASSLKAARSGLICALVLLFGVPLPILSLATAREGYMTGNLYSSHLWAIYLAYPFGNHLATAPIYACLMVVIGLAGLAAEKELLKQQVIHS